MTNDAYLPLAELTPPQRQAAEQGTLVAASDRLRREYAYAYDHGRMSAGDRAWHEPSITGFDALLRRDYERARLADPDCPRLLSAIEQHVLVQSLAPQNLAHLTALFEDAWQLVHGWDIDFAGAEFDASENTSSFKAWAKNLQSALQTRGVITGSQLADQVFPPDPVDKIADMHLTGFDVITPQQKRWLEKQEAQGAKVSFEQTDTAIRHPNRSREVQRFPTTVTELTAAICWAKDILEAAPADKPLPRIAIVVPDLLQQRATLVRLLHAWLEGSEERTQALYNIGGGQALAQHPLVESALALLGSIHQPVHFTSLERLLADPALPGILATNRLPETCAEFLTLAELPHSAGPEALRVILRQVSDWGNTQGNTPARTRDLGDWWRDAASVLRNARWHTARNDSEGFQATNALLDMLISQAPETDSAVTWSEAYALLASVAEQTLFAPASLPAPIQVLGYLEALELKFDHLWITSMDATSWPAVVTNNPFLPPSELAQANVPRTSYASELEFATTWLERVTRNVSECRASFVSEDEPSVSEAALSEGEGTSDHFDSDGMSPLLSNWQRLRASEQPSFHPLLDHWRQQQIVLEPRNDTHGSTPAPGVLPSAIRRLENQAACPMRGWGIYTLDLDPPIAPHSLPNPMERGTVLHNAAKELFEKLPSSEAIAALDIPALKALCLAVAEARVAEEMSRYSPEIRRIEVDRLNQTLFTFVQLESARDSFHVEDHEIQLDGQLGPWQVSLRVDRVDNVENGQVVIDYKSSAPSLGKLLDDRLSAPQIPLYVLLLLSQGKTMSQINLEDPLVQAGAFAELKPDSAKYVGLRADAAEAGMPAKLNDKTPWREVLLLWRERLLVLSNELESGLATADPAPQSCNYCHLRSLCRYHLNYD